LFWHVLIRYPGKADCFHKVTKQFGLARRSGTFSKIPGVRSTKGFWSALAEFA